jgi:tight adherence protein B
VTDRGVDEAAASADRLAVLLGAGLPPPVAWSHLAGLRATEGPVGAAADAAGAGRPVGLALAAAAPVATAPEARAWRAIGAGVTVAERTGAPLASVLEQLAGALRDQAGAERDVLAALTGPRLSARLVMALPVVGVAFGLGLGFNPIAALLGTAPGLWCGALGIVLFTTGWLWTRRLVRRARPADLSAGFELELVAVALMAGTPFDAASAIVREAAAACGLSLPSGGADASARLAAGAGVPIAALLRGEARLRRRRAAVDARIRAESLGVTLLLPLGLCILPAFMLLAVAPLLLSILASTVLP